MEKTGWAGLKPKGHKRSDEIRAMTKGSGSKKRRVASTIAAIPRMSPSTLEKRAIQLASDPEASAIEIMQFAQKLAGDPRLSKSLRIVLLGKLIQAHTAIHGSKVRSVNINIDATTAFEDMMKSVEEFERAVPNSNDLKEATTIIDVPVSISNESYGATTTMYGVVPDFTDLFEPTTIKNEHKRKEEVGRNEFKGENG